MPIPTFREELGQTSLGPNISIIRGAGLSVATDTEEDDSGTLSIASINKEIASSSRESIEFFPEEPAKDLLFENFIKNQG